MSGESRTLILAACGRHPIHSTGKIRNQRFVRGDDHLRDLKINRGIPYTYLDGLAPQTGLFLRLSNVPIHRIRFRKARVQYFKTTTHTKICLSPNGRENPPYPAILFLFCPDSLRK
jgi:hypothetical protein